MEFDENKCIAFINDRLASVGKEKYDGDELLNIVDMVYDYYDSRVMLDIDDDSDDDMAERPALDADIASYVRTMLRRDKMSVVKSEDVDTIVCAELDYEESIDE